MNEPKGSLPYSGQKVARGQHEAIKPGAIYELHGSISSWVMWGVPDAWIEHWLGRARTIVDPSGTNRFTVVGAVLHPDGRFAIQVIANHGSPLILIASGIVVALSILAGMTIEQIFEVIPEAGQGVKEGVAGLVILAGLIFAGVVFWKRQQS